MTGARDRAVIALASQEVPMNTVQGSDQQVRVERVRGIEPPLRAWEPRSPRAARFHLVTFRRSDQRVCVSGVPRRALRASACSVACDRVVIALAGSPPGRGGDTAAAGEVA